MTVNLPSSIAIPHVDDVTTQLALHDLELTVNKLLAASSTGAGLGSASLSYPLLSTTIPIATIATGPLPFPNGSPTGGYFIYPPFAGHLTSLAISPYNGLSSGGNLSAQLTVNSHAVGPQVTLLPNIAFAYVNNLNVAFTVGQPISANLLRGTGYTQAAGAGVNVVLYGRFS